MCHLHIPRTPAIRPGVLPTFLTACSIWLPGPALALAPPPPDRPSVRDVGLTHVQVARASATLTPAPVPQLDVEPGPGPGAGRVPRDASPLGDRIRTRLTGSTPVGEASAAAAALRSPGLVNEFYGRRGFEPAWIVEGEVSVGARALLRQLEAADREGLRPEDYHVETLRTLLEASPRPGPGLLQRDADLELLLSDAFFLFGSHLLNGRVDPEAIIEEWDGPAPEADLTEVLEEALRGRGVATVLDELRPSHPAYGRLTWALAHLRRIADRGGWPTVPAGEKLEVGAHGPRVRAIRERLQAEFDLPDIMIEGNPFGDLEEFDGLLAAGVKAFQERHGLLPDGVVGARTLQAMNVTVEERIRQIEVNLERWRWLPRDLGDRYVLVNVPAFTADVVEDGEYVLRMRSIVGQPLRQTPVFSGRMSYLVFAPFWNVPETIATEDKYPEVAADPAWVAEHHYKLFPMYGDEELDPYALPWDTLTAEGFAEAYRLRQDPGPWNALGRVKFMFPNDHDIYLHDTPERNLFDLTTRNLSSGCVRIDKPVELAEYLLSSLPAWDRTRIMEAMSAEEQELVGLPEPIPVHVLYWTSFVDDRGRVNFREDLYERDRPVARALANAPPRM